MISVIRVYSRLRSLNIQVLSYEIVLAQTSSPLFNLEITVSGPNNSISWKTSGPFIVPARQILIIGRIAPNDSPFSVI